MIKYRNNEVVEKGMVRCPICGSDKFTTMDKELILKEADDYIRRNGKLVEEKKEKKNEIYYKRKLRIFILKLLIV